MDLNIEAGQEGHQLPLLPNNTEVSGNLVSTEERDADTPGAEDVDDNWLDNDEEFGNIPYFLAPVVKHEAEAVIDAAEMSDNSIALSIIPRKLAEVAAELGLNTDAAGSSEDYGCPPT